MSNIESTVNPQEINKFAQHANLWWDTEGPLKTLHDINKTRFDFIKQHVELADLNVLDVGCGGGILCESMARSGAKVTGIDAESEAISVAQEHANSNHLKINYLCTSIEAYKDKRFDVITCMEMLEHVENPELVFEHCRRLLKPQGFLFVSTISRTIKAYATAIIAAEYVLNLLPRQTHDYKKFIKPSELLAMARPWDFNLIDLKGMDYNPFLRSASLGSDVRVNYLMALQ
ncbi:bifunctional 2-polyprenyl-6-hydroxyphenol methylase/3-demethylubiquinol 3-O-methyltransferase UbiG [Legionella anisa]|uniref:Ubiquinone biosynthesis O-methyltransferase n=1 Tax=Legionella anisa TaxID=28082 RepID=A0AAX0WWR5_9GAMM|nr:bifunctional 2-polyprenyl-6-hydroxyphenol methylase/3-demethylubiquinol 3-O-methyltransferase UbiG [Legionella anisa]AWN74363.1 bifunctional 2-polyprenyl-6-hydroxyphenol methylase/3-demethylubiquinol 3-O-methyltransferase UbiG [Legionella anisa]KTC71958.1 3-demethylubiquinone-9 3-methyltransferase [Legionella anisa]MBN5935244.1 bifunctional 2-polyprenyl-6-hydroxyphenol methylase/3-demethylubiquinol 3-O-methyltransferase UbiG [Legionella anisa]MCW8425540.1 bifunctional 2-polyprenyl-6-hydroxyp